MAVDASDGSAAESGSGIKSPVEAPSVPPTPTRLRGGWQPRLPSQPPPYETISQYGNRTVRGASQGASGTAPRVQQAHAVALAPGEPADVHYREVEGSAVASTPQ